MNRMMYGFAALPLAAGIGSADAAVVADGQLASDTYGPILFVQDTPTGFGDNTDPSTTLANGSEIDGVYATVEDGNLNVLVTGNLETNFNRLVLYIDSESGGQNTLDASTGGPFNSYSGLTFDTGFGADYGLVINGGNDPAEFFLDFGDIGSSSTFVGQSAPGANTFSASNGINVGIDQSNVAGVTSTSASGAAAVTTGLEFVIPLSVIGSPHRPDQRRAASSPAATSCPIRSSAASTVPATSAPLRASTSPTSPATSSSPSPSPSPPASRSSASARCSSPAAAARPEPARRSAPHSPGVSGRRRVPPFASPPSDSPRDPPHPPSRPRSRGCQPVGPTR